MPRSWQAGVWESFNEAYPLPWDSAGNILPMETGFSLDAIKRVACQELNTLLHHDITQGLVEAYLGFNRVFSAWEALTQSPMEAKRRSEQAQYRNYQNKWAGHQAFGETYELTRAGDLAYGFLFDGPEQVLHGLEDVAAHYVENVVQYGRWQGPLKTLEEDVFATLDYLRQLDLPQSVSDFWYESPREKGSDLFGVGLFAAPGLRALKTEGVFEGIGSLLGKRGWFRGAEEPLVNSALEKYPKQLEQYSKLMNEQLEKAIKSHENQIAKHQTYLNNPKSRVPQWENLSKQHQENLFHHWRQDISRHEAYSNIAQEILRQRKEELSKNGW